MSFSNDENHVRRNTWKASDAIEYQAKVTHVLFYSNREDAHVIYTAVDEAKIPKTLVHQPLKDRGRFYQSKGHQLKLIYAVFSDTSSHIFSLL